MNFIEKLQNRIIEKKTAAFKNSGILRYFSYSFGSIGDGMTVYVIEQEDEQLHMIYQKSSMRDGKELRRDIYMPLTVMQKLKKLLMDEKIFLWNGFNKTNSVIATGRSFVMKGSFDKYNLKAEGMVMMPPAYEEKHELLNNFLEGLVKTYGEV